MYSYAVDTAQEKDALTYNILNWRDIVKSILVIGVGRFGHHLVNRLLELGNKVMVVDKEEDNIRDMFPLVTTARVGDCTNIDVLKTLGLGGFDLVIVCIAQNFQNSLEVTSLVKEMGARYVISMASRDIQAKFLLKNGADEVLYPERDVAYNLAERCSAHHVFDYVSISDDCSLYEIPVMPSWVGRTMKEINVRAVYNVNVIAVIPRGGKVMAMPPVDYAFNESDHVKVIGYKKDVDRMLGEIE